jgi:hypothetical protein
MKSRSRGKKELLHPIFLECRDHTDNEFWKSLYEDMAYGKYPKQIYINQHQQIQSTNRNVSFQYTFKNKSVEEILTDLQDFLLENTNLISNEEIDVKKTNALPYKKDVWVNWKDIKKKYIRDILLMDYCIEIKRIVQFHYSETSYLYELLNNLVSQGRLYEVHMENNKIKSIDGIEIKPELQMIYIYCDKPEEDHQHMIPDMMSHYCKRFLLRHAKIMEESKKMNQE